MALIDRFPARSASENDAEKSLEAMFKSQLSAPVTLAERSKSKRQMLGSLPSDWREQIVGRAVASRSKHALAIAVLSLAGVRPEELANGVKLSANGDHVCVSIGNAKQGQKTQSQRTISISCDASRVAKYLHAYASKIGSNAQVKISSKNALRNAIRRFGERLFPRARSAVSPYAFRHQFAADQKSATQNSVHVAKALGHSSDKMQSRYGSASQGKSGRAVVVESTLEPRAERAQQLQNLRARSREQQLTRTR